VNIGQLLDVGYNIKCPSTTIIPTYVSKEAHEKQYSLNTFSSLPGLREEVLSINNCDFLGGRGQNSCSGGRYYRNAEMIFDGCNELEDWERLADFGIAMGDVNQ
jgi:hypothetical protein